MTEMFSWNRHGHLTLFSLKTHPPPNSSLVPGIHKKVVILTNICCQGSFTPPGIPSVCYPMSGTSTSTCAGQQCWDFCFAGGSLMFIHNDNQTLRCIILCFIFAWNISGPVNVIHVLFQIKIVVSSFLLT